MRKRQQTHETETSHSVASNTTSNINNGGKSKAIVKKSRAIWTGRFLFIVTLCTAAAVLACVAYRLIDKSEYRLADTQFESIADRALIEIYGKGYRKRHATITMASFISEMHPNADDWPFVAISGYERTVKHLLNTSSGENMGFIPIVTPDGLKKWETFAYDYYYNSRLPEPFSNDTAVSDFGRGVWDVDRNLPNNTDQRYRVTTGNTTYNSPNQIITPVFHVNEGKNPVLMYNFRSHPPRGRAVDRIIKCTNHTQERGTFQEEKCGTVTEPTDLAKFKHRGPATVILQPIYPANNRSVLTGILCAAHPFDELLKDIFGEEINGIDCVLKVENDEGKPTQFYTWTVNEGKVRYAGEGDLHNERYESHGQTTVLNGDAELYCESGPVYSISLYPNDKFYDIYATKNARVAAIGAVCIILFTSLFFFLYDFTVRRDLEAKKTLLEAKRGFMRFVSHEVRTPLNAVCMGLTVLQMEVETDAKNNVEDSASDLNKDSIQLNTTRYKELQLLQEVEDNAMCAVDVLNDFLNYDKIEQGTLSLDLSMVSIWSLIERTTKEFNLPAAKKNIDYKVLFKVQEKDQQADEEKPQIFYDVTDLPEAMAELKVAGDSVRIKQVLRNLISNAIKFTTKEGGGNILVEATWIADDSNGCSSAAAQAHRRNNKHHHIVSNKMNNQQRSRGRLQLCVTDNGEGMSKQQLSKLFGEGVQFNVNKLQAGQGSGLGLFISKNIVDQHNGTLEAFSDGIGHGSTFTFTLPLFHPPDGEGNEKKRQASLVGTADDALDDTSIEKVSIDPPQLTAQAVNTEESPAQQQALKVLIVDDAASNRKLLERILTRGGGHICDQACNGQEAIEMVSKAINDDLCLYDTILMDYEMPIMNGPEAVKEIRSTLDSDVFIVGITGNMLPEDVSYFKSSGANAVLPKPFKMKDLEDLWYEHSLL